MANRVLIRIVAVCAGLVLASESALATCSNVPPSLPAEALGDGPLVRRYADLIRADKFADAAGQAEKWRVWLADARSAGGADPRALARGQAWYAYALEYADKADLALPEAREALRLVKEGKLAGTPLHVEVLSILSMLETDERHPEVGEAQGQEALALAHRLFPERSAEESLVHNALGTSAYAQGRYSDAEREYGLASTMAEACLPPGDAFIVNQMASHAGTLYMVGRIEDALSVNERAARWALTNLPESNPTITLALGNLGTLLNVTGRLAEAEAAMRKVVDLEGRYQAESWFYRAISLSNFASIIDARGRHEEAEAYWLKSLEFHGKATIKRDPITPAYPLRFAADAAQARGDLKLALARRRQAVAIMDAAASAENPERARAHLEQALTLLRMRKVRDAQALAEPAMAIIRKQFGEGDTRRMTAEVGYARLLAAQGDLEAAYALASGQAARLETRLLDAATRRSDIVRFGPAFAGSFSTAALLALQTGRQDEAFRFLQLANLSDIALVTREVAARAAAQDSAAAARIRAFQDLLQQRQVLDRQRSFSLSKGDAAEIATIARAIEDCDARIAETGAALDRDFPAYRQLGRPVPQSLHDFRNRLGRDQVLLAPLLLEDAVLVVAVTHEGLAWERVAVPRHAVLRDLAALRGSIDTARESGGTGVTFDFRSARRLGRLLMAGKAGRAIAGKKSLLYHASGPFGALPPALLIASNAGLADARRDPARVDWLLRRHAVTVMPSLAEAPGKHSASGPRGGFLGVGAPLLRRTEPVDLPSVADLPVLPHAASELQLMASSRQGGAVRLLTGGAADEGALRRDALADYGVIAFATHALVGGELAGLTEPALVLSTPAEHAATDDGLLTASEIMQLHLDADWVILSACNTASGDMPGGSSFGGLAAAFAHAGARALLVSHWPVRDDVAARLTTRTLALHDEGLPRAEALRRAMIEVMADRSANAADPSAWAPFVLVEP